MQYLGGKSRAAKHIVPAIVSRADGRTRWVEPFVGGAAVAEIAAAEFTSLILSDSHEDLILMWRDAVAGRLFPTDVSEQLYRDARASEPSALRGFIGFACSFGAKWWGGYARNKTGTNYAAQGSRAVERKATAIRGARVVHRDYRDCTSDIDSNTVVYCDPPYAGTTGYKGTDPFDHTEFWGTCRAWADAGALVFVSEYSCPDEVGDCVWERPQTDGLRKRGGTKTQSVEKLFQIRPNVGASVVPLFATNTIAEDVAA